MEYARYQLARKQVEQGTPLEQFAFLTAAEIESLKVRGIFTVEALASLDVEKASGLELQEQQKLAKRFMAQAKDNKILQEWQQKEDKYLEEIKALKEKITELQKGSLLAKSTRRKK